MAVTDVTGLLASDGRFFFFFAIAIKFSSVLLHNRSEVPIPHSILYYGQSSNRTLPQVIVPQLIEYLSSSLD